MALRFVPFLNVPGRMIGEARWSEDHWRVADDARVRERRMLNREARQQFISHKTVKVSHA